MKNNRLKVKEIFYSIQGEGAKQGQPSIFIRLAGCNLNCLFCDTDWKGGEYMTIKSIIKTISKCPAKWIIWTGGEPTLQLTNDILSKFPRKYKHAIETNGTNPVPSDINYISCSPKVSTETLNKNFEYIHEIRYPFSLQMKNQIPNIKNLPIAGNYYVSPLFDGKAHEKKIINPTNVDACLKFIKKNPEWKISIQLHKLINIE